MRQWFRLDSSYLTDGRLVRAGWEAGLLWPVVLARLKERDGVLDPEDLHPALLARLTGAPLDLVDRALAGLAREELVVRGTARQAGGPGGYREQPGLIVPGWREYQDRGGSVTVLGPWSGSTERSGRSPENARNASVAPVLGPPPPRHAAVPGSAVQNAGRDMTGQDRTGSSSPLPPASPPGPRRPPRREEEEENRSPSIHRPSPAGWDWHAVWLALGGRGVSPPPVQLPRWVGLKAFADVSPEQLARVEQLVSQAGARERPLSWLMACLDEDGVPLPAPTRRNGRAGRNGHGLSEAELVAQFEAEEAARVPDDEIPEWVNRCETVDECERAGDWMIAHGRPGEGEGLRDYAAGLRAKEARP